MSAINAISWTPLGASPWPRPAYPPVTSLAARADVAIIGAGVTGLSAALRLAAMGREVLVIDRAFGDGAACRSGGIVLGDTLIGVAPGFEGCEDDLRRWVQDHDVRGGINWRGCIELDRTTTRSSRPIDWRDAGVVRAGDTVPGGTLDPAALVEALAREAHAQGARFVNGVDVSSITSDASSVTESFCGDCDRLRLTADGQLRTCLFAHDETDLRGAIRAGADDAELERLIRVAVGEKQWGHEINRPGFVPPERPMSAIGG